MSIWTGVAGWINDPPLNAGRVPLTTPVSVYAMPVQGTCQLAVADGNVYPGTFNTLNRKVNPSAAPQLNPLSPMVCGLVPVVPPGGVGVITPKYAGVSVPTGVTPLAP